MPSKSNNTLSADQQKLMEIISQASAALAALSASSAPPKKGAKKVKTADSSAEPKEKKPLNPKIAAMNVERMTIYQEMKSAYFSANPSAVDVDPKELKERVKKGELPPPPTYPEALKEHSRRMRAADPEHDKKAQSYRDSVDAKQAENKSKRVVKTLAPLKSEALVTVIEPSDDPEVFNMKLKIGNDVFNLNGKNWVLDSEHEWIGLWDPIKKEIDRSAPEPEDEDE